MASRKPSNRAVANVALLLVATAGVRDLCAYKQLFPASEEATRPAIAVRAEPRLWVVVWEQSKGDRREIVFSRSSDGHSFSPPKTISRSREGSQPRSPAVAADKSGNIDVVWADVSPKNPGVFFTRSNDGGKSFSPPREIAPKTGLALSPKIAIDSEGHISVVWTDSSLGGLEILFSRSTDGGKSFSKPVNLSQNKYASEIPQIALDGRDNLYVAWRDKSPPTVQIWFARSRDGGKSFSPPKVISRTGFSDSPAIAAEGDGQVYVAWASNVSGNLEIYFLHSANGGETFGRLLNVSGTRHASQTPSLAADGEGKVYVAWADNTPGNYEVFFRYSPDRGESFFKKKRLSPDAQALSPTLTAVPGYGVFVVWESARGIQFVDQEEIREAPVEP